MTTNQIAYQQHLETKRHNLAMEGETYRTNVANEAIKQNQVAESVRHNTETERETHRTNVANEVIATERNQETRYHNEQTEYETHRSNVANENLETTKLLISAVDDVNKLLDFGLLSPAVAAAKAGIITGGRQGFTNANPITTFIRGNLTPVPGSQYINTRPGSVTSFEAPNELKTSSQIVWPDANEVMYKNMQKGNNK